MGKRALAWSFIAVSGSAVGACGVEPQTGADMDPHLAVTEQAATVCGDGPTVKGIDVSRWQQDINWTAVAGDGVEFAFIRASDGLNTPDTKFEQNWAGAKANGILRGAYQYFRPNQDPIEQADLLLAKMGPLEPGDLPPVIDIETMGGMSQAVVQQRARAWIEHVKAATGMQPIIYTGFYFWRDEVGAPDFTDAPLWHAQYTTAPCPNIPPPWTDWALWQFTDSGPVAGITTGGVDINRFNGTRDDLLALARPIGPAASCVALPAEGGVIDDGDPCFTKGGPSASLRPITDAGHDGDLVWTYTTASLAEANFAQWNIHLAEAGSYQVEIHTPAAYAKSRQARYDILANGVGIEVTLDQTAVDGWQSLGTIDFAAGGDQWIHLGDNTGEPGTDRIQLAFDAVRVTRVVPGDSGEPEEPDDGLAVDDPTPAGGDINGGCSTGGASASPLIALGLLGLLRRRKR